MPRPARNVKRAPQTFFTDALQPLSPAQRLARAEHLIKVLPFLERAGVLVDGLGVRGNTVCYFGAQCSIELCEGLLMRAMLNKLLSDPSPDDNGELSLHVVVGRKMGLFFANVGMYNHVTNEGVGEQETNGPCPTPFDALASMCHDRYYWRPQQRHLAKKDAAHEIAGSDRQARGATHDGTKRTRGRARKAAPRPA